MRKVYLTMLVVSTTFTNFLLGQTGAVFNGNQIEATIFNKNGLFTDFSTYQPAYIFPIGSNTATIYTSNLWMYGRDSVTNTIKGFGDKYFASGQDTWPGPLTNTGTASTTPTIVADFDKVWKITQSDIDSFIVNYNNGNVTSMVYPVPNDMITWPVDAGVGFEYPLSPFYDHNSDGNYNVYDGDYPIIKGKQMLRWIFNDNYSVHTEGNSPAMGVEIQADFFGCSNPDALNPINRTTFLEYNIINRSTASYKDVFIGLNIDGDIGGPMDDYLRSNISSNTIQFYNGDSIDNTYSGIQGYINDAPVQSISILKMGSQSIQPIMSRFISYYNGAGVTGDPNGYDEQYNYLRGMWKDASNLVYGGDGYPAGPLASAPICKYMYPGDSDPALYGTYGVNPGFNWSEENTSVGVGFNSPGDRRGVFSIGPINLSAGENVKLVYAFVTTQNSSINTDSLLKLNIDEVNQVTTSYLTNALPCVNPLSSTINYDDINNNISLFPNPSSNWIKVKSPVEISFIELVNIQGSVINTFYNENIMNIENLPEGMYFTRIHVVGNKTPIIKKIIVAK